MTQELSDFFTHYSDLSTEEINAVVRLFRPKTLSRGEHLLQPGSRCNDLVFVQAGCLRMYYVADAVEISVWFSLPGSLATELASFISEKPSDFYVQAIESSELLCLPKPVLNQLYQTHPNLHATLRRVWEDVLLNIIHRFISLQNDTTEQRYLDLLKEPDYAQLIPQKYLASFIGVTPSSLSRIRRKLARPH